METNHRTITDINFKSKIHDDDLKSEYMNSSMSHNGDLMASDQFKNIKKLNPRNTTSINDEEESLEFSTIVATGRNALGKYQDYKRSVLMTKNKSNVDLGGLKKNISKSRIV